MNAVERVRETVRANAGRPFLIDVPGRRTFTYGALHELARALAGRLRTTGLRPGQRVGILLGNAPEFAALYLACLYAGLVAVPVNPALGPRDLAYALDVAGIALLAYSELTRALIPAGLFGRRDLAFLNVLGPGAAGTAGTGDHPAWSVAQAAHEPPLADPLAGVAPEDLFVITFTSGTTGRPKGVCHTVGSLLGAAEAFNRANGVGPGHRYYHVLSMSYMAGLLNTLLCPFLAGGAVAVDEPFGPQSALRFWAAPREHGLNTLWLVPTICTALLRLDRDAGGRDYCRRHVRLACVGTAPLPGRVREDFERKYGVPLMESYGLSETLFVAANVPGGPRKPGSVGRPLAGVELRAADEAGAPLAGGCDGELQVRTPYQMAGYLDPESRRPEPPAAGSWFATGDLGRQDADGSVFITGRKKDLIIRGGLNISPRGIEEVLLEHPAVQEAAVVGVPHAFYGEQALAALQLKPGHVLVGVQDEVAALCRRVLGPLAVPGRFVQVEDFPRTATGKVSKAELRARLGTADEGGRP